MVWTFVAFGGVYFWTLLPAAAALIVTMRLARPPLFVGSQRALDTALASAVAVGVLQLLPLPPALRNALSPHAHLVEEILRFDTNATRYRPLTVDFAATCAGAWIAMMAAAMFWATRAASGSEPIRRIARGVAWSGLAVSVIAIASRASAPALLYGIWNPGEPALPFGPFINRNHMGTWLILALPFVLGYLLARADRDARFEREPLDLRMLWLGGAAATMFAAVIVSLSRSAAVGLCAAGLCGSFIALRRGGRATRWVFTAALASIAITLSLPKTIELADRFENSGTTPTWNRAAIWRETIPIVRDFRLTGVGVGGFETAMLVYQKADRRFFFNQAHNQYLQFAAEGGLLLLVPLASAAVLFAITVIRRLGEDRSPMFWIRAGAVASIVGVMVQSIWETGLRMPANALLFAVVCAAAVREESR